MTGTKVLCFLRRICVDLDHGRRPSSTLRRLLIPVALPAALGLSAAGLGGCGAHTPYEPDPGDELCDNGADDDGDDLVDCDDPDCDEICGRVAPVYAEPFVELCDDGFDNDGDGAADCDDPDCDEICGLSFSVYAEPFEEQCGNGGDDDGDGLIDCDDPDCLEAEACEPMAS